MVLEKGRNTIDRLDVFCIVAVGMAGDADVAREIEELRALVKKLSDEKAELEAHAADLAEQLAALKRYFFDRRRERVIDHPELPFPGDEAELEKPAFVDEAPDDEDADVDPRRKKPRRPRGVKRVRGDLPRKREVIDVPEDGRRCTCGEPMQEIGEDVTEVLEYRPASFFIREIVRKKYACREHEEQGVRSPELPARAIAKGMAGPGLLAQVITAKYKDHLPLHRQHGIYLRQGVDIAESTMVDWVREVATLLGPVVEATRESIAASPIVSTDDTPICVQDRAHPKGSRTGYLWAYLGEPGDVVFRYTRGRSRDGPLAFFGDYAGYVQADAYSGYDALFRRGRVTEVGCWAHARRRFFKSLDTAPEPAKYAIAAIRSLYEFEVQANKAELDADGRRLLRQQEARPLLEMLRPWLVSLKSASLPKSPIGKAAAYALNQWDALTRFLDDGRLALDNNRTERAIRQVAIGRKNWMFAGSDAGAERAAAIYSVIGGCIELKLDPFDYLEDVIHRLAAGDDPRALTPRAWAAKRN
jgi:transposase